MTEKKNKNAPVLYVLTGPARELYLSTARETRQECWSLAFDIVVRALGEVWMTKYWRRLEASIAAAERAGYHIVKARLVFTPEGNALGHTSQFKEGDPATWTTQGGRGLKCEVLGVSKSGERVKILLEPPNYPYRQVTYVTAKRLSKG